MTPRPVRDNNQRHAILLLSFPRILPLTGLQVPLTIELDETADDDTDPWSSCLADWDPELEQSVIRAVWAAADFGGCDHGWIGVMVTDDPTIHEINRRHLEHDYPTDVISFTYEREAKHVEGELVVSLCTARRMAEQYGWDWRQELLLYVAHGTLHICGYEDSSEAERMQMRAAERTVLAKLGITPPDQDLGARPSQPDA